MAKERKVRKILKRLAYAGFVLATICAWSVVIACVRFFNCHGLFVWILVALGVQMGGMLFYACMEGHYSL